MERQQGVVPGEPVNSHSQEFLTSGRTGRRNALPDILSEHAVVTSADLPARLQALSTRDEASTSSYNAPKTPEGAGPSKQGGQNNTASWDVCIVEGRRDACRGKISLRETQYKYIFYNLLKKHWLAGREL